MGRFPLILALFCALVVTHVKPFSLRWGTDRERRTDNYDLKKSLLGKLGLSRIPDVRKARTTEKEMNEMLEIYERSRRENEQIRTKSEEVSDVQRLHTFKDNAPRTSKRDIYLLSFPVDIGNDRRGLILHSAKLHIFKKQKHRRDNTATVELYQLMESYMLESPQALLIESRKVEFSSNDWEVFDVTKAVATWLEKPSLNFGFELVCNDCSDKNVVLVTANSARNSNNRAILDISIVDSTSRHTKRSHLPDDNSEEMEVANDCSARGYSNLCCRGSMWISFKDIGWNWVVKPEGFDAYYCKGECPYDYINYASTHSLLQSIYSKDINETIPLPCCVPKSLKPLSLLHYNDSDPPQLVVSSKMGMIAESCGCA